MDDGRIRGDGAGDTLDVVGVPDLPHPVLGWRTWRLGRRAQRRTELTAPLAGVSWPARQPMIALCGSRSHTPPGERCRCGLYAVADPGTLEWGGSGSEVLGVVALWGRIVEGTHGWRASRAYPRFVIAGPGIVTEQRAALARRYGVPVHRSEVPPRELASLLSAEPAAADALRHGADHEVEALLAARMAGWADRWQAREVHGTGVARVAPRRSPWAVLSRAARRR